MSKTPGQRRLRFDAARLLPREAGRCQVEVSFTFAGAVIQAEAEAEAAGAGPMRAAAEATLLAIDRLAGDKLICALADIDRVSALGKNLIAVLVDVTFRNRQSQVFGSCQVGGDELDAAVRATLNALNRLFELAMEP